MIRRLSAKLHLYVGLATALLVLPIGFTGGVLVFHDEIDAALHPGLVRVEGRGARVPVDRAAAAVAAAFPGRPAARLELPQASDAPYEFVLRDGGLQVFVDPYTGDVLGARRPEESLTGLLFLLHTSLLVGPQGEVVVGVVGLLLLVLGVTGLVLWWRGRRQLRRGLTVAWGAPARRVNYDVHNAGGFYALLPLMVVAFTGAGLVFYGPFSGAAHALTGTPPPPPPPTSVPRPGASDASVDAMLDRARAAFPDGRVGRVDFPAAPEAAYRVRLKTPSELHPVGLTMAYFDRYSGALLRTDDARTAPAARRFGYLFYPLHIGAFGGFGIRLAYALLGLAPVLLAGTGAAIWLVRWHRKRGRRRGAASSGPARPPAGRPAGSRPPDAAHKDVTWTRDPADTAGR